MPSDKVFNVPVVRVRPNGVTAVVDTVAVESPLSFGYGMCQVIGP